MKKNLVMLFVAILSVMFTSCNNETVQWARVGVESGNNNKEIYRNIPTQFWVTAPEGEQIFVRSSQGTFIKEGKELDGVTGFTVTGIGEGNRMYFDIVNAERGDVKIDVSYPNSGTNSLELRDAVNSSWIEIEGATYSVYSEIFYQNTKPYLRISILANRANTNKVFTCSYTVNGFLATNMQNGYVRGQVDITSNDLVTQYLEPLSDRADGLALTTFTKHSVAMNVK
ncbi:MAG: hypothetical protein ACRC26_08320 [Bacteroidales bacterium]